MPEMDGVESTAEIRKMKKGANIPIIACTGHAIESDAKVRVVVQKMLVYVPLRFLPSYFAAVCGVRDE